MIQCMGFTSINPFYTYYMYFIMRCHNLILTLKSCDFKSYILNLDLVVHTICVCMCVQDCETCAKFHAQNAKAIQRNADNRNVK